MSTRGKKSQATKSLSQEMSPSLDVEAPLIVDPLQPENLLFSPRPTRTRKPSQKVTAIEADENASPPPIFSVPRISGRRKSMKKRPHQSSDDETNEVDEDVELGTPKKTGRTYKTKPRKRRATIAKSEYPGKTKDRAEEVVTPVNGIFPQLATANQPREYKSPYQAGPTLPVLQEKSKYLKLKEAKAKAHSIESPVSIEEPVSSEEESEAEKKIVKKTRKPYKKAVPRKSSTARTPATKKSKAEVKPRTPSTRVASKAKSKQADVAQIDADIAGIPPKATRGESKARKELLKQASVEQLQQRNRALVTSIAESMTQEQLLSLVVEGACDVQSDGVLFSRLLQEQNSRACSTPSKSIKSPRGNMNMDGPQDSRSEKSSTFGITSSDHRAPVRRYSGHDQSDDFDESDDFAHEDDHLTATEIDRMKQREKRADQWKNSSKAYLVPEGQQPPKKGPIPVGIAKKRKNVVSAGFDYRMRFHYRLTKYDRDGNLIGHDGTPAIRRDLVDFHPTLAHLSEEEFFREVLKRQLTNEAKGIAY